ncbi:MAG: hypothetical protein M1824_003825 [Vezdaea acicularis]|nr:MAG: hypothetical protein M1824_003825 [Vezdaea acicularis]
MASLAPFNTKSPTIKRILREHRDLTTHPTPSISASPLPQNLFVWHFTIAGPPNTAFHDGLYHGTIHLPPTYPLRPPSFRFLTPSGRFEVNRDICLSISGFHEEAWQPAWGIRTALLAIRGHMSEDAKGQIGGLEMVEDGRRELSKKSRQWVCSECGGTNGERMKEWEAECRRIEMEQKGGKGRKLGSIPTDEVPKELGIRYRDEMGRTESDSKPGVKKGGVDLDHTPTPTQTSSSSSESAVDTPASTPPAPRPRAVLPDARPREVVASARLVELRRPNEESPLDWYIEQFLDYIILAVAVLLGGIILRKWL